MMKVPATVLFVEDESAMRDLVAQLLADKGFHVLLAADGYEALRVLTTRAVDLMLTDVVMPGLSGFQLARQAKLIQPDLKVLYTSGHAQQAAGKTDVRYGKLLPKPLRPAALLWEINTALAAKG